MLSAAVADRVRRLVPRLTSDFTGEVVACRDAIARTLTASGCDWHDLAASIVGTDRPTTTSHLGSAEPPSFGDLARAVRDLDGGRLLPNELTFVLDMCRRGWSFVPSPRQSQYMADLYRRLASRKAAA